MLPLRQIKFINKIVFLTDYNETQQRLQSLPNIVHTKYNIFTVRSVLSIFVSEKKNHLNDNLFLPGSCLTLY